MLKLISSPKFLMISLAFLALIIVPVTLIQVQNQQTTRQNADEIAWMTSQSASSSCPVDDEGAIINVTFTNTEPNKANLAMNVLAVDAQSGKSVNLGSVKGQETKNGEIKTGKKTLQSGKVTFKLTWTDGHSGTDSRTASYQATGNCDSDFAACPAGTTEVKKVSGSLLQNASPTSQTYTLNLPEESKISVVGFAKEGHPEDCPNGPSCNQGQLYEEFSVAINGTVFGETEDKGAIDAWYEVGPWETASLIAAGDAEFKIAHRKRNPNQKEPDSVDYKLTICRGTVEPTEPPGEPSPTPTICPTLGPVQNVKITCPNCP